MLILNENVNVLDLNEKKKKSRAEVAKIYRNNKSSFCEILKNEKSMLILLSHLKLQKLWPHCMVSS